MSEPCQRLGLMKTLGPLEKWEEGANYRAAIALPREPDAAQLTAHLHVAFARWKNPWENTNGASLVHWLVVSHDECEGFKFKYSSSRDAHPSAEVVNDLLNAVSTSNKSVWVVAPSKQRAIARELLNKGLFVTLGLSEENRAVSQLITRMNAEKQHGALSAQRDGPAPGANQQDNNESLAPLETPEAVAPTEECRWLPVYRAVAAANRQRVVLAADASPGFNGVAALAVVSELGDFGLRTLHSASGSVPLEFETLIMALGMIPRLEVEHAIIQNDCESALLMANLLAAGHMPEEGYCGIPMVARERFIAAIESLECGVEFHYVRGHVGRPLNEAADSIANLARTAAMHPREGIEEELLVKIDAVRASIRDYSDLDMDSSAKIAG